LIKLENVWKTYRPSESVEVHAVRGVSLTIKDGEFVAIVGASGSGKSTLMHLMGCLDIPTKGRILLDGKDISKMDPSELARIRGKVIGFVFQNYNLIPSLTALQNVELPMIFQGVEKRKMRERAVSLLQMLGLGDRMGHLPNQLSGGQQQRVAIARALANNPKMILADEPTGNLDSKSGKEVLDLLVGLNKKGKTLVVVTHDKSIAKKAKRIVKIKDGRIVK